ncbi:sensor domain-containing protein [Mycolicibacterium brumae]|nr:sensor domain-containing protein [Mycolicibacterium brumae]
MGTVYAVDDPALPRVDALKVLSSELSADPQFRARFLREADIAAVLDHPNIVSVYDRGETRDRQLWIAMQFVDGTDADDALKAGTMTTQRALHIAAAVADALDYAHSRAMVHRDVKPANFLLAGPIGDDERVLLGDFGIARALDDAAHHTATGSVMATMPYASPEAIEGVKVDGRADQYSLACSLYRMLTGRLPFDSATGVAATMMAHLTAPPPRVSETAPWLPAALDGVFATGMAKDPAQRFGSCLDLVAAARAAFGTVSADGPTAAIAALGHPSPKASSQRKRWLAVGGVALLLFGGTTVGVMVTGSDSGQNGPVGPSVEASAAPIVPDDDLSKFLLSTEEIDAIAGTPLKAQDQDPYSDLYDDSRSTMSDSCTNAMYPLQKSQYSNSGYSKALSQKYGQPTGSDGVGVIQSVVAFPSEDLAKEAVNRQRQFWPPCLGTTGSIPRPDNTAVRDNWAISKVDTRSDVLTVTSTRGVDPKSCQHALALRRNVLIDTFVCRSGDAYFDDAKTIATQIADRVPTA